MRRTEECLILEWSQISIGPIHHGKPELKEAEELKIRETRNFIADRNLEPQEVYNKILQLVPAARNCYRHQDYSTQAYDNEAFARMMLLDGLQYIYLVNEMSPSKSFKDVSHSTRDLEVEVYNHLGLLGASAITVDIMLLENQLPFLVLDALIRTRRDANDQVKWDQLIENFIVKVYISGIITCTKRTYKDEEIHPLHILELLRKRFLVSSSHSHSSKGKVSIDISSTEKLPQADHKTILSGCSSRYKRGRTRETKDKVSPLEDIYKFSFRSATELKSKGIHFRPSSSFCLNDFAFTSRFGYGELTLPQLVFDEDTRYILLNMMAYELAPSTQQIFHETCSYVYFMNTLMNGADDAMELRLQNIIHNFHGTDEEVAKAFNSMSKGAAYQAFQGPIKDVSTQIQEHYNSRTKTWMAQLLNKYFDSPWSAIAFIAATLALVLTALQTFFGIYPRSSN